MASRAFQIGQEIMPVMRLPRALGWRALTVGARSM